MIILLLLGMLPISWTAETGTSPTWTLVEHG